MKIRTDYVSNSSSSSFIVAYDKKLFKDFEKLIGAIRGYETQIYDLEEFFDDDCMDKEFYHEIKTEIEKAEKNKMGISYFSLDYDFSFLIEMFEELANQHGKNKFKVIYDSEA
jgi:hypothetical protein